MKTDTAKTKVVATTVPPTGTLKANRESSLAADVTGRVIAVHVERGSRVKKGDVVAQIDRRGAQFALAEASAHMAAARTHSAQANLECQRAEKLFAGRAISEAEYQATKSQCEAAEHGVTAAAVKSQLAQTHPKPCGSRARRTVTSNASNRPGSAPGESAQPIGPAGRDDGRRVCPERKFARAPQSFRAGGEKTPPPTAPGDQTPRSAGLA